MSAGPSFVLAFNALVAAGRTCGFINLVRPLSFEEQCEEERRIRDVEDAPVIRRAGKSPKPDGRRGRSAWVREHVAEIRFMRSRGATLLEISEAVRIHRNTIRAVLKEEVTA